MGLGPPTIELYRQMKLQGAFDGVGAVMDLDPRIIGAAGALSPSPGKILPRFRDGIWCVNSASGFAAAFNPRRVRLAPNLHNRPLRAQRRSHFTSWARECVWVKRSGAPPATAQRNAAPSWHRGAQCKPVVGRCRRYGRRPPVHRILAVMALSLAIIGAGMGGLTLAAALHQRGIEAQIYEQAPRFVRLGAGIQMSPNAMRVLRGIGLEPRIRATAFQPRSWTNRDWDTGRLTNELPLGAEAEAKYGAPYLLMHRGDLHEALVSRVPSEQIALDKKLVELDWRSGGVTLRFADGTSARADAVIAADGIHSRVRELWLGAREGQLHRPRRLSHHVSGGAAQRLCHRSVLQVVGTGPPHRHLLRHRATATRSISSPACRNRNSPWNPGRRPAISARCARPSPVSTSRCGASCNACPRVHKWAIVDRDPLPRWSDGAMVLLGDAAHPMTQYMAQGAATAMEDAVVLSRCIAEAAETTCRRHLPATRRRAGSAPRASRAPRRRTPSCASRPIRTGSMATTPGPRRCRNTPEATASSPRGKLIRPLAR